MILPTSRVALFASFFLLAYFLYFLCLCGRPPKPVLDFSNARPIIGKFLVFAMLVDQKQRRRIEFEATSPANQGSDNGGANILALADDDDDTLLMWSPMILVSFFFFRGFAFCKRPRPTSLRQAEPAQKTTLPKSWLRRWSQTSPTWNLSGRRGFGQRQGHYLSACRRSSRRPSTGNSAKRTCFQGGWQRRATTTQCPCG